MLDFPQFTKDTFPGVSHMDLFSGLFGVDSNLLGRTLGIPAQLLSVRANASRPSGFFSSLGNSTGAGLGSTVGGLAGALGGLFGRK